MRKEFAVEGARSKKPVWNQQTLDTQLSRQGCSVSLGAGSTGPGLGRVGTPWLWREDGLAGELPPPGGWS